MTFNIALHGTRRDILRAATATATASALALPLAALAQSTWPSKPVTLVVPFPPGGGTDTFARPLSAQFSKLTGKQLIIDNRGGAGGTVGAGIAAKAAPDDADHADKPLAMLAAALALMVSIALRRSGKR